ncbi:MAG TPA: hypothetical protein VE973_04065 [Candidatus Limnocylindria bacterium]|nr:hypothetical protein [Candidatus Limnocylindria bacterium]
MKYLFYILAIIILLGLNLGIFGNLQVQNQIPNLLLLLVICFSLEKKGFDFFFIAFISGIFLDSFSAGFFGGFTLSLITLGLLIHFLSNNLMVMEINWKSLIVLMLGSLVFVNFTLWLYGLISFKLNASPDYVNFHSFISGFAISFLYNLTLLYPMYLFYNILRNNIDSYSIRRRGVVR